MTTVSAIHLQSPQQIKHGDRDLLTTTVSTAVINKVQAALNSLPLIVCRAEEVVLKT